jgi:hypothetical protein
MGETRLPGLREFYFDLMQGARTRGSDHSEVLRIEWLALSFRTVGGV